MNSIVFAFDGDALLVANTGAQFTRKGVVSICYMDLSAKTVNPAREPDDSVYTAHDKGLIREILDGRIEKYDDPNDFIKDVNREEEAAKSYFGRFVLELLQNADDAMGDGDSKANLIGTKGIGFKSVLEITDEPEIYSGDFCFQFSREKSREVLEHKISKWRWNKGMGIPICSFPHPKKPDSAVQELLNEGYATVLRLPLKEGKRKIVEDQLTGFCSRSLLFCQNIESVYMQIGDATRDIRIHRSGDGRAELIENGLSTHWQVWDAKKDVAGEKRLSVRMCLPVVDGEIDCLEEIPRLHVFFPTAEQIPNVHALIHASCEVEDNRQHLATHQPHQGELCEMLAGMTEKVLSEIPPNAALRAFGRAQVADDGRMASRLGKAIAKKVQATAFIPLIGGDMAKPGDVRLWEFGLGDAVDHRKVRDQNLCHPDINYDERSADILINLGAKDATDLELARLLRFCRNQTQEECLRVWNVAQSLMANVNQSEKAECESELRQAPFWLVANGKARAIDGEIPLVAVKPRGLPRWLRVDVVDKEFMDATQEETKRHREYVEGWKNTFSDSLQPPESKRGYFNHVLLPYCEKLAAEEWQKSGWEILELAFKWGERVDKNSPLIIDSLAPKSKEKQERAEVFRLPVGKGDREWAPAWQCYAGVVWGGPRIFDEYFARVEDRYVLSSAGDWKIDIGDADKAQWKKLLSWLGCSWGWKMKAESGLFSKRNDVDHTSGRPFSDFCFEHFDEMLAAPQNGKDSDCAPLLSVIPEMYEISRKEKARYFRNSPKLADSYALKQLEENEWLPCEKSLLFPGKRLFKPEDAYFPGSGLGGLLPEVKNRSPDSSTRDAIKETLKKLGVKDGISKDPKQLIDYMNRVSELAGKNGANTKWTRDGKGIGEIARAAKAIFSAYAKIENRPPLTADVMLPCLRHTPQGEEVYFEKAANVRWADESYFDEAEVRREILDAGNLHVFFRFLQDGAAFGLDKLSEHLRLEPQYGDENPDAAEELRKRYDSRRVGMAKATGQKLPERLDIVAYNRIALRATAHAEIKIPKIKFWERGERDVAINAAADMWQGLAAALGELTNGSQYKPDFELLLKEKTWESFLERLRDDYDLTEESIQEVEESAPSEDGDAGVAETDSGAEPEADSGDSQGDPSSSNADPHRSTSRGGAQRTTVPGPENNASGNRSRPDSQSEAPKIKVVPDYPRGPERYGARKPGVSSDAGDGEREAWGSDGKRGEEALLKWLQDKFGTGNVTNMNEQSLNNPGYDIRVVKNGEEHYYECKSFAAAKRPRRVSMTKAQFEKAKSAPGRYWLCVIYDANNAGTVQMIEPRNPAAYESEPVVSEYKIDLTSRKVDTEQSD